MTHVHTTADKAAPAWAVFGAPLVGVPLMVALLALGSGSAVDRVADPDVGIGTEQVEMHERDAGPDSGAHND